VSTMILCCSGDNVDRFQTALSWLIIASARTAGSCPAGQHASEMDVSQPDLVSQVPHAICYVRPLQTCAL